MATLDTVRDRIVAVLTGAYPATPGPVDRQIPPDTFRAGRFKLALGNPTWPSVDLERRFDLFWTDNETDPPGLADCYMNPQLVTFGAELRIDYKIVRPNALTPVGQVLDMGAFEAATRKAHNDWRVIEWALMWPPNWANLDPECVRIYRTSQVNVRRVDDVRIETLVALAVELSVAGTTDPGLG